MKKLLTVLLAFGLAACGDFVDEDGNTSFRQVAEGRGIAPAVVALAWLLAKPGVTAPIIGPRTYEQGVDNLGAVKVQLGDEDFERIDALVPPCSIGVRYYDEAMGADFRPHHHRSVV